MWSSGLFRLSRLYFLRVFTQQALSTQITGNAPFSSSYKYNSVGNGMPINKTDGSHTFFAPHFSNAILLDSSHETANTISKQDDVNSRTLRNQMMLDAQNHNISTQDPSNFSYSDTTASSNNNTSNLQVKRFTLIKRRAHATYA